MCANGTPYHKIVPREEGKLPTINLEGLLTTVVIDVCGYRTVETFDVPGA